MIGKEPRPSEQHMQRTRELHDILVPALRETARRHGYALAVHGSLQRDIDLVAIPWRDGATDTQSLVENIYGVCEAVLGWVTGPGGWTAKEKFDPPSGSLPNPEKKPHGRLAWTIHMSATYIDLSVMPRVLPPPALSAEGEKGEGLRAALARLLSPPAMKTKGGG